MELLDLTLFERVVREGSISRAAAALGMAQSAVSTRVRNLEAELRRPLLVRGRRGVQLSEAGESFLPYVQRCLRVLEEGCEAAAAPAGLRLRIGMSMAATRFATPVIERFVRELGGTVNVTVDRVHALLVALLDGALDLTFMPPLPLQAGLTAMPVARGHVVCFAAADHPLATGAPTERLQDLLAHRLALCPWGEGYDELVARLEALRGAPLAGLVQVPPDMARYLMLHQGYLSFLPDALLSGELAAGKVVRLELSDCPPAPWQMDAVFRDRKHPPPSVAAFLRLLTAPDR